MDDFLRNEHLLREGFHFKHWIPIVATLMDSALFYGYNKTNVLTMSKVLMKWFQSVGKYVDNFDLSENTGVERRGESYDELSFLNFNIFRFFEATYGLGGILGSVIGLSFAKQFGRKGGLLMSAFLSIFGALFCGYAKYFETVSLLFFGRFLLGVKSGVASVLAPIYIVEIAPQRTRVFFLILYSLVVSLGVTLGLVPCNVLDITHNWPLVLSLSVIPAIVILFVLPYCPESPKYLYVVKGQQLKCKRALKWLRGNNAQMEIELKTIEKEFRDSFGVVTLKTVLSYKVIRQATAIVIVLVISHDCSGITGIMLFYHELSIISSQSWLGKAKSKILLTIIGAIFLFIVDMFPRRTLLITSYVIMAITGVALCLFLGYRHSFSDSAGEAADFQIQSALYVYLLAFKLGIGSLIWLIPSEYFSTVTIHYGYAIAAFAYWNLKAISFSIYIPMQNYLGYLGFINYAFFNLLVALFVYYVVPETRNKSVQQVYGAIYLKLRRNNGV